MERQADQLRLLPWSGAHGQPCLLLTDGDGFASRLADRVENVQLGLADRLLGRTREVLASPDLSAGELGTLAVQLTDALGDALLIARSRGDRLGGRLVPPDGVCAVPSPVAALYDVLAFAPGEVQGCALLTLPGRDLASARAARRHVGGAARSWGLPPRATEDLETIAGELVVNALEHSDSHTVTVTCVLTVEAATISVTDEGVGRTSVAPVAPVAAASPGPEQECGRGLLITDALATRWGSRRTGHGLTVWAELTTASCATVTETPDPAR